MPLPRLAGKGALDELDGERGVRDDTQHGPRGDGIHSVIVGPWTDEVKRGGADADQSGEPSGPVAVPSGTVVMLTSSSRPLPPEMSSVSTGPTPGA
jgi:hypothetical protein